MADPFIVAHIRSLPLFSRLDDAQAARLAPAAELRQFDVGELIFHQGQPTRAMIKLISGSARLWQWDGKQQQLVGQVNANQYFNDKALVRQGVEVATLQILEAATILVIHRDRLLALLAQNPDLRANIPAQFEGLPAAQSQPTQQQQQPPPGQNPGWQQPAPNNTTPRTVSGQSPANQRYIPPQQQHQPAQQPRQNAPAQRPGIGGYGTPTMPLEGTKPPTTDQPIQPPAQQETVAEKPTKKVFRSQRDGETVLIDTRRHWWAYGRKIWMPLLLAIGILALSTLLPLAIAAAMDGLALVVFGVLTLYFYLEWRNDHLIVTSDRILHIERVILTLQQRISQVPLASIQEVNADEFTADPFSRVFYFGKIEIKTPGDSGNIEFNVVPKPLKLQNTIFEYRNRAQESQNRQHEDDIRGVIDRVVTGGDPNLPSAEIEMPKTTQGKSMWSLFGWQRNVNKDGQIIYRKHWLIWLGNIWLSGLLFMAAIGFTIASFFISPLNDFGIIAPIFGFFLMLASGIWVYWTDWDWRNDMYIIDTETIQIVHKRPLWLQSETDQIFVSRIDNVVSDKGGLFQSIFDYGDLRLSLVGADENQAKVFKYVPAPEYVQSEITQRQERLRKIEQEREENQRREEIAEYLKVYHETTGGSGAPSQMGYTASNATHDNSDNRPMRPPNIPRA